MTRWVLRLTALTFAMAAGGCLAAAFAATGVVQAAGLGFGAVVAASGFTGFALASCHVVGNPHITAATRCYCPGCNTDLVRSGRWVGPDEEGLEVYHCAVCGRWTHWLFDAPTPLLVNAIRRRP